MQFDDTELESIVKGKLQGVFGKQQVVNDVDVSHTRKEDQNRTFGACVANVSDSEGNQTMRNNGICSGLWYRCDQSGVCLLLPIFSIKPILAVFLTFSFVDEAELCFEVLRGVVFDIVAFGQEFQLLLSILGELQIDNLVEITLCYWKRSAGNMNCWTWAFGACSLC